MSLRIPEIPAQFGALDSTAFTDGDLPSAHILRELARSANRLYTRGEVLLNWVWDAGQSVHEISPPGALSGFALPFWHTILPTTTRPKKPGLTRARMRLRIFVTEDLELLFQVSTRAAPFDQTATSSSVNTVRVVGTNDWQWVTLDNIPISEEQFERIGFHVFGMPAASVYSGGGTASGTLSGANRERVWHIGAAYNTTGNTWANLGSTVVIEDPSGNMIANRWVISVPSTQTLEIFPPLDSASQIGQMPGLTYELRQLPRYRLGNISLYQKDRT